MDISGFDGFAEDLEEFADDIEEVRRGLPDALDTAVEDSSEELHKRMQREINRLADNPSGNLASTIRHDPEMSAHSGGQAKWSVGPTADYAKHVEYGTGTKGDPAHASGNPYTITAEGENMGDINEKIMNERGSPGLGELKDVGSLFFDGSHKLYVEHPGSKPTPFWRTAIYSHEAQGDLPDKLDRELDLLFKRVMG